MKKISLWAAVSVILLVLAGCSLMPRQAKYTYDFPAIYLDDTGTISEIVVEDFDKEYYNADELRQSLEERVRIYNTENGKTDAVVLDKFEYSEKEKRIKVIFDYATVSDYQKMNNRTLYIGTISEAKSLGFIFGAFRDLQSQDEKYLSPDDVDLNLKVVIFEKDERTDGTGGQEFVSDKYTLLYECQEVSLEDGGRPLRATVVQ